MATELTEKQRRLVDMAAHHAEDFSRRVAQHDREGSFPFENIEAMKASGYTNITVPQELGGSGAGVFDFCLAQHRLAQGDGPTAISVNMHLFIMGLYGDLWHNGNEAMGPLLETVARQRLIRCAGSSDPMIASAVSLGGLNDSSRQARKVEGGYRVSGRSAFNTLCVCADLMGTSAHYDDPHHGPMTLSFTVPASSQGIKVQDNWDTMGIRSSASQDIIWDDVFVPEQSGIMRPARKWTAFNDFYVCWFHTSIPSCYLGIAQAARDYAVSWVARRSQAPYDRPMTHDPGIQRQVADMEMKLRAASAVLWHTVASVDDVERRADPPLADIIASYHFVTESAVEIVDLAMRLVGGAAMFRSRPLEQMYRDVRAGLYHQPLAGDEGMTVLGRLALGLRPYPPPGLE